jgi:hypothetical protein
VSTDNAPSEHLPWVACAQKINPMERMYAGNDVLHHLDINVPSRAHAFHLKTDQLLVAPLGRKDSKQDERNKKKKG